MWQFYILPIGISGHFSSAHTALVCVFRNSIHAALLTFGCTIDYWQSHFS